MNKCFMKKLLSAVLSFCVACPYAYAGQVGVVSFVEGRVDMFEEGSDQAMPAIAGDKIAVGDSIRTKSNSKAAVIFDDDSVIQMGGSTKIEVKDYVLDADMNRKTASVMLHRGRIRSVISKMDDLSDFKILTPNAEGTITGSELYAFYKAGSSGMLVTEGLLSIHNPAFINDVVQVPAGNSVLVPRDAAPLAPRAYMDLEKRIYESETYIPASIMRKEKGTVIIGAVARISGEVNVIRKGKKDPEKLNITDVVREGDKIVTGPDGVVKIAFDNGNNICLKSDTELLIISLIMDPETGEYENLFQSNNGKIKALIENLKGKSRFEVKTPTAVAGARGTIMYLVILPGLTRAYFEGGTGYLKSAISGSKQMVGAGENSTSDGEGNVSDPSYTSEGERESFDEGFDEGGGVEGYSSPEDTPTGDLGDTGTDGTGDAGTGGDDPTGGDDTPGDVPITETTDTGDGGTDGSDGGDDAGGGVLQENLSGAFGYLGTPFEQEEGNNLKAALSAENAVFDAPWKTTENFTLEGTYEKPEDMCTWKGDAAMETGGGAVRGRMGGTFHSWESLFAGIFIDQGGYAGTAYGYFYGTNDEAEGSFTGAGEIQFDYIVPTGITPEELLDPDSGALAADSATGDLQIFLDDDNGELDMEFMGTATALTGQTWGVWDGVFYGAYNNSTGAATWTGVGGYGPENEGDGYYLCWAEGQDNAVDSSLSMNLTALHMTTSTMRFYEGGVLGVYGDPAVPGEDSSYEAIGMGVYAELPLAFGGHGTGGFGCYDAEEGGVDLSGNDLSFVFGDLSSPFRPDADAVLIGRYDYDGESRLWATDDEFVIRMIDGSIIVSAAGGIVQGDDTLKGLFLGLYVRPDGQGGYKAGYIESTDLTATMYDSIGMFDGQCTLNYHLDVPTGITPDDIYPGSQYFDIGGDTNGYLSGEDGSFKGSVDVQSISLNEDGGASDWGVWKMGAGGSVEGPMPESWTAIFGGRDNTGYMEAIDSYWVGTIDGVTGLDGAITGTVSGTTLSLDGFGVIDGNMIGVYHGGDWEGLGGGTWHDEGSSVFSGLWGNGAGSIYGIDSQGGPVYSGYDGGVIISTEADWLTGQSFNIRTMGQAWILNS
ncbi:MAG: FecR domain-containing protein, partial [Candidatus Omnitrophica bacterium]|nr:FecR domain-containing protein [Candidatus Omnitrophota bacterium]